MTGSDGAAASRPEEMRLLVARYREDAYRLARHLVRSPSEAEDLAHTAILNVLRRADSISDEAHVRPYLMTAVRNAWRNQLRARGSRRFLGADYAESLPSDDLEPEERVLTRLDVDLARAAYAALSPTSREIIKLRYIEELNFPEVAARLSISPVAARQRAHRAREELIGACIEHAATSGDGKCRTVRRRLGRYHRGLLSQKARSEVGIHLAGCPGCQSCFDQLVELYGQRIGRSSKDEDV